MQCALVQGESIRLNLTKEFAHPLANAIPGIFMMLIRNGYSSVITSTSPRSDPESILEKLLLATFPSKRLVFDLMYRASATPEEFKSIGSAAIVIK